jgi:thioesterase domain-containing protein
MEHLPSDLPLYDVHIPTVSARLYDAGDVLAAVDECIEAIRVVQPCGPYYLAGHCYAGLVMLETALRLRAMKEDVGLLALIDPDPEDDVPIAVRIVHHLRALKRLDVAEHAAQLWQRAGSLVSTLRRMAKGPTQAELQYATLYETRWARGRRTYPFPTALLLSQPRYQGTPRSRDSVTPATATTSEDLTILELPGNPVSSFQEPLVRVSAELLARCFELAQDRSSAGDR